MTVYATPELHRGDAKASDTGNAIAGLGGEPGRRFPSFCLGAGTKFPFSGATVREITGPASFRPSKIAIPLGLAPANNSVEDTYNGNRLEAGQEQSLPHDLRALSASAVDLPVTARFRTRTALPSTTSVNSH